MYDYSKVFNAERIKKILRGEGEGRRRCIFFLDEGGLCETVFMAGFSAVLVQTEEQLAEVTETLSTHRIEGKDILLLPCCYKETNAAIRAALDDTTRFIGSAWRSIFTAEKTREYYLCYPDEFTAAAVKCAEKYLGSEQEIWVQRFSDIEIGFTDWLWYPYIAKGNITILYAAPGAGKSFFTCWLAAAVSNGAELPGEPPKEWKAPVKGLTLFFNAEDPVDKTLKPRLIGCDADMTNIATAERWNDPDFLPYSFADPRLPKLFEKMKPELVVFDPIQSYIGADVDMHRANQTRPLLARLNALARTYNFALVVVCHINKMTNQDIGDRIIGSQDIKGAARSALFLGQHPEMSDVKLLFQLKNNLAEWGQPVPLRLTDNGGLTGIEADMSIDTKDLTPERCTGSVQGKIRHNNSQRQISEEIIKDMFSTNDMVFTDELKEAARNNSVNWREFSKVLRKYARWGRKGYGDEQKDYYIKR